MITSWYVLQAYDLKWYLCPSVFQFRILQMFLLLLDPSSTPYHAVTPLNGGIPRCHHLCYTMRGCFEVSFPYSHIQPPSFLQKYSVYSRHDNHMSDIFQKLGKEYILCISDALLFRAFQVLGLPFFLKTSFYTHSQVFQQPCSTQPNIAWWDLVRVYHRASFSVF